MIDRDLPVTTDELHAYVDGVLPADRKAAVEAWLASHPEDAARVAEWRAQAQALRARYHGIADQPVPGRFDIARLGRSVRPWRAIAAAAVIAAVTGGLAGWLLHGASAVPPNVLDIITTEALNAHRLYIGEARHPDRGEGQRGAPRAVAVETRRHQSARARSQGLLAQVAGREAAARPDRPGGDVHVREGGRRALHGLLLALEDAALGRCATKPRGEVAAVRWVESEIGFVVSGPADRDRLSRIAETAYEQMDNPPARTTALPLVSKRGS